MPTNNAVRERLEVQGDVGVADRDAGFAGACSVRGGMTAWRRKALPIEQGGGLIR